jgi:F-type H+-transporting ATPase subunit b
MTGGGNTWLDWVFKIVNFVVLVGILVKFGKKPIMDFLLSRHNKVRARIDEAEHLMAEAETLKKEYEARLAGIEAEIEAFKAQIVEETAKERDKVLDEARAFAAKIQEQAKLTYDQEIREVTGKIKEEIAKLAIDKAEKFVKERVDKADNDRMVEEFIEKLRSLN